MLVALLLRHHAALCAGRPQARKPMALHLVTVRLGLGRACEGDGHWHWLVMTKARCAAGSGGQERHQFCILSSLQCGRCGRGGGGAGNTTPAQKTDRRGGGGRGGAGGRGLGFATTIYFSGFGFGSSHLLSASWGSVSICFFGLITYLQVEFLKQHLVLGFWVLPPPSPVSGLWLRNQHRGVGLGDQSFSGLGSCHHYLPVDFWTRQPTSPFRLSGVATTWGLPAFRWQSTPPFRV